MEEVDSVKREVHNFFRNHFKRVSWVRPLLCEDFVAKRISERENEGLIALFSEDEVWEAIQDYDN